MNKCPDEIIEYMHNYLDDDLSTEEEHKLRSHLQKCENCREHFHELKRTIALVQSTSHIHAPVHFTDAVMSKLPKQSKRIQIKSWFRNHPFLSAASLFIILMLGSIISSWNKENDFSVTMHPGIIIENDTAIIPEGTVIDGDVVVKNGNIRIEGKVNGDVTTINGEKYLASAGEVTGNINEVNEIFEWLWFHIKDLWKGVVKLFK